MKCSSLFIISGILFINNLTTASDALISQLNATTDLGNFIRENFSSDFQKIYCKTSFLITKKPYSWKIIENSIVNAAKAKTPADIITIQDHILWAIRYGDAELVKRTLDTCSQFGCPIKPLLEPRADGASLLHFAAARGEKEICIMFIHYGASLSVVCQGRTALQVSETCTNKLRILRNLFYECGKVLINTGPAGISLERVAVMTENFSLVYGAFDRHRACFNTLDYINYSIEEEKTKERKEHKEIPTSPQEEYLLMRAAERARHQELTSLAKTKEERTREEQKKLAHEEEQRKKAIDQELKRQQDADTSHETISSHSESSSRNKTTRCRCCF